MGQPDVKSPTTNLTFLSAKSSIYSDLWYEIIIPWSKFRREVGLDHFLTDDQSLGYIAECSLTLIQ